MILTSILLISLFSHQRLIMSQESFFVTYSDPNEWSKDQFVEFIGDIPELKELSSCHWQKDKFFAERFSPIWEFCSEETTNHSGFQCVGVNTKGLVSSANRHVRFESWLEHSLPISISCFHINVYRHKR